jgi:molybdopterin synthase catalytic subunit
MAIDLKQTAFAFSDAALDTSTLQKQLHDPASGGYCAFEGWVRNNNEGHNVIRLEYEAFVELAVKEGKRIVSEAIEKFGVKQAACVHRVGSLEIGDVAVWVGVSAGHRDEAFRACRYIIDAVKVRVPIWKKEHYVTGNSGWVNCERCAEHGLEHHAHHHHDHAHDHAHSHQHKHD